jgi:hypothetical protein
MENKFERIVVKNEDKYYKGSYLNNIILIMIEPMQITLKNTKRESIFSKFIFYFFSNHPSHRFNQNISPTSYSNDSNHSVNTHIFLLPYIKWNLNGCQVGFKNSVYSKRSGDRVLCGTTIVLCNRISLAECIETPYILKILHIGVSIQILQEDAKFTRRPDITLYRNP